MIVFCDFHGVLDLVICEVGALDFALGVGFECDFHLVAHGVYDLHVNLHVSGHVELACDLHVWLLMLLLVLRDDVCMV